MVDARPVVASPRVWRDGPFQRLVFAESVSRLGTDITVLALPTLAIQDLAAGPLEVGTLAAAGSLPFLVFGLPSGVIVDRLPRRAVMIACDLGRLVVLGSVPVLWLFGALGLPLLYVVAVLSGTFTVFATVARQAFLPALVGRPRLGEANSLIEATSSVAAGVGQGLAGILIDLTRPALTVALDAASYALSAMALTAIPQPRPDSAPRAPASLSTLWSELVLGIRETFVEPRLRAIAITTHMIFLGRGLINALVVLYAYRELGLAPTIVGIALACGSVGRFGGSLAGPGLARRLGIGPSLALTLGLAFAASLLIPFAAFASAGVAAVLLAASIALTQGAFLAYIVNAISLRQRVTPDDMQGRVGSTLRTIGNGSLSIGAALGGVLGGTMGLAPTIIVGSLVGTLGMLVVWRLREPSDE
ncbi:MAG: MFS transporter [Chloroflexota bacterium]